MSAIPAEEKIWIIGAGAIGGLVGAHLTESLGRARITLVDTDREHVETIKREGLTICDKGRRNGQLRTVRLDIKTPDAVDRKELRNVILAVKCYSNAEVLTMLDSQTQILALQNGYDERLERFHNLVRGIEFGFACQVKQPGQVYNAVKGRYVLGRSKGMNDSVRYWAGLLGRAAIKTDTADNIDGHLWSKLLINSALNPVSAISGSSVRQLMKNRRLRELFRQLYREGYPVVLEKTRRLGGRLGAFAGSPAAINWVFGRRLLSDPVLSLVAVKYGDVESSMLQDIRRKRPTEIDFINGAISRLATEYGMATPLNDWVRAEVAKLETECSQP